MPYSRYSHDIVRSTLSPQDKIKEKKTQDRKKRPSTKIVDQLKHRDHDRGHDFTQVI